jgi:predicted DNA-binding protein
MKTTTLLRVPVEVHRKLREISQRTELKMNYILKKLIEKEYKRIMGGNNDTDND